MKKIINLSLSILILSTLLLGCSSTSGSTTDKTNSTMKNNTAIADNTTTVDNTTTECNSTTKESITYMQIEANEAMKLMETESNYIILDVRTPEEYAELHIPDAINIPNDSINNDDIPELPDKDQLILVYCRSGNRSKQAAEKLVNLGYTNIVEFGGINDWPGDTVSENK